MPESPPPDGYVRLGRLEVDIPGWLGTWLPAGYETGNRMSVAAAAAAYRVLADDLERAAEKMTRDLGEADVPS